jgi:hypothetical protein
LQTTSTICDTFENLGACLILVQITGTCFVFNPFFLNKVFNVYIGLMQIKKLKKFEKLCPFPHE